VKLVVVSLKRTMPDRYTIITKCELEGNDEKEN
jgi:hypothetical protein